jgi:hypothetical protein
LDGLLREKVEDASGEIAGSIMHFLKSTSLQRLFSLRQEFSSEFHRLLHGPDGQEVRIEFLDKHLPVFWKGLIPIVKRAFVLLDMPEEDIPQGLSMSINGTPLTDFKASSNRFGGLPMKEVENAAAVFDDTSTPETTGDFLHEHKIAVTNVGEKLSDIMLFVEYGL